MTRKSRYGLPCAAHVVLAFVAISILGPGCEDPVNLPPAPEPPPGSPEAVVTALSKAYQQRSPELLTSLLANEHGANADYLFLLGEPTHLGETQWNYAEKVRIHQRMFRPDQPPPGDPAVHPSLWLEGITITLTPLEEFQERGDLYSANDGADGKLDSRRWRAVDARYSAYVFFDLAVFDYKIDGGEANFVVIEDLEKQPGEAGKFLLFSWEDLGRPFVSLGDRITNKESATWGSVKDLYR